MGRNELLMALLSLLAGTVLSVMVSCVWTVLHLPARLQGVFRGGSPRMFAVAMLLGMMGASLSMEPSLTLALRPAAGAAGMLLAGVFVGMLASALEKILEVAPVLLKRFRLENASPALRWVMLAGKTIGAVLGCLLYPP